ncbi:hypothetical protein [Parapedobacter tibetensis]|uniref:hypothetical protein n=1 Tax=Parapedobacter tibetensis TaxID=2972951 RepID=UPI00214D8E5C|nr:hypothetical protein [Parapedobacter tibetensis]
MNKTHYKDEFYGVEIGNKLSVFLPRWTMRIFFSPPLGAANLTAEIVKHRTTGTGAYVFFFSGIGYVHEIIKREKLPRWLDGFHQYMSTLLR